MSDDMMCIKFRNLLDLYMDDELNEEEKAFMKAHAQKCASCEEELRLIESIKGAIGGLDDDITVPLPAQAAWRNAVRKEIKAKKRKGLYRSLTSAAAAVVVLIGATFALREGDRLPARYKEENAKSAAYTFTTAASYDNDMDAYDDVPTAAQMRMAAAPEGLVIEADGEVDSMIIAATDGEYMIRSAEIVKESADVEKDVEILQELTEEYEGYVSENVMDYMISGGQATIVSRIPEELLDDYLSAIENVGDTVSVSRSNQNANEIYYDVDSRLESKKAIAEEINQQISGADGQTLESLNQQLNAIYEEIDSLQRLVNTRNNDLSYAKVRITLIAKAAASVTPSESTLGERSVSGFKQSLSAIGRFLQDMVVSVAVIAPAVLIVAVIGLCTAFVIKGVKKARKDGEKK